MKSFKLSSKLFGLLLCVSYTCYAQTTITLTCGEGVQITETEIDSKIGQLRWVAGSENSIIYGLTTNHLLYKSSDDGKTWTDQIPFMQEADVPQPGGRSGVKKIYSGADEKVLYFQGYGNLMWVTKDDQKNNYELCGGNHLWNNISPHPTNDGWLLADAPSIGCTTDTNGHCFTELYVSKDYCKTWTIVGTYIYLYSWARAGKSNVPVETMWTLQWPDKSGEQRYKSTSDLVVYHSTSSINLSSPVTSLSHISYLFFHDPYLYFAQQNPDGSLGLIVSTDDGKSFTQAQFPFEFLNENQYIILDDSEGSLFLNVRHSSSKWGHVYSSDSLIPGSPFTKFDLSLPYNWRDSSSTAQYQRVLGLNGIYIANQLQNVEAEGNSGSGIKTVVSFNKGGDWGYLPIPKDTNGRTIQCDDTSCQLNLHVTRRSDVTENTYYGPFYSNPTAIGIVIATGNMGEYLDNSDTSNVDTYLSRDGGWSWLKVLNGTFLYDSAAHGSIILFADNQRKTNTLKYSWNEGLSVNDCLVTNGDAVDITDIKADPSGTTQSFLVYGKRQYSDGTSKGVIFHVDFTGLKPNCVYPNDYEYWSPRDYVDDMGECLLGQYSTYTRRKQEANCINSADYEVKTNPIPCDCTREDYECDECFELIDGVCSKDPDCFVSTEPPTPCVDYYNITSGYRLVPGNLCNPEKGLNLLPKKMKCPQSESNSSQNDKNGSLGTGIIVLIVFMVVLVVGGLVAVCAYVRKRDENFQISDYFFWNKFSSPTGQHNFERISTALDEDLLEAKEAEPLDDDAIEQSLNRAKHDTNDSSLV